MTFCSVPDEWRWLAGFGSSAPLDAPRASAAPTARFNALRGAAFANRTEPSRAER